VPISIGTSVDLPAEWVPIWVGIRIWKTRNHAIDDAVCSRNERLLTKANSRIVKNHIPSALYGWIAMMVLINCFFAA
jgi:hypothetical protein